MCSPSILTTVLNPIGAIAQKIGGVGGFLFDPVGGVHRAVAKEIGGPFSALIDPDRILTGEAFAPKQQASGGGAVSTIDGGVATGSAPTYTPPTPAGAFNPPGANQPSANTYAEGMNKFGRGTGQFSTSIDETVMGPFNQGGQKAVRKVQM